MTTATIREAIDAAGAVTPEPPRPLRRELPPPEAFPVDALSELAPATRAIVDRTQAPAAIPASAVLAAASHAVQAHAQVELPYGQTRPVSLYLVTVADSGERKTTAEADAMRPQRTREAELRAKYGPAAALFENQRDAYDAERRRILTDKLTSRGEKERDLADLGPPPAAPPPPILEAPEPTIEGLLKLAAEQPSLLLASSEGGQFLGGFGMSPDHRLKTVSWLSAWWDGQALRRVRGGDGASVLAGRRLAMSLLMQPGVAEGFLGDAQLADQGTHSRLLVTAPTSTAGTRFSREPHPSSAADLDRYEARLLAALRREAPRDDTGGLMPRALTFAPDASRLWSAFADHVEGQLGAEGELAPIRSFASKMAEHAARLGAVLALAADLDTPHLDAAHLEAGIALAEHFASEWLRLRDASATRPEIVRAEHLARWLRDVWPHTAVGLPECYQRGPHAIRDARTAREAMALLEEHGHVLRIEAGAEIDGMHRREAWRIAGKDGAR